LGAMRDAAYHAHAPRCPRHARARATPLSLSTFAGILQQLFLRVTIPLRSNCVGPPPTPPPPPSAAPPLPATSPTSVSPKQLVIRCRRWKTPSNPSSKPAATLIKICSLA
jgi:hypothetical protein